MWTLSVASSGCPSQRDRNTLTALAFHFSFHILVWMTVIPAFVHSRSHCHSIMLYVPWANSPTYLDAEVTSQHRFSYIFIFSVVSFAPYQNEAVVAGHLSSWIIPWTIEDAFRHSCTFTVGRWCCFSLFTVFVKALTDVLG